MFSAVRGLCRVNQLLTEIPYPRTDLSHGLSDGDAERGVTVEDGNANLNLGDLFVEVPRHAPLAHQFDTMHLRLDATTAMVSAASSPRGRSSYFDEGSASFLVTAPTVTAFPSMAFLRGGMTA